ncbi:hypothetical protein D3C85_1026850 [compost metagenome]
MQLLIATLRPLLRAGIEENLHLGLGENHCAHVTAIGNEARQLTEGSLAAQQRFAHAGEDGDLAGGIAHFLGADGTGDILPFQHHLDLSAVDLELHVQIGGQGNQCGFGVELHIVVQGCQRQYPVDGTGVEQVPTQFLCQQLAQGAFTGSTRAINCHHGGHLRHNFSPAHSAC